VAEQEIIAIQDGDSIIRTRQEGRELARRLGFGSAAQTRLATAIAELVRNVLQHGGGSGTCKIQSMCDTERAKIRVLIEDQGPGIGDIDRALQDGFSTAGSPGAGLPGTRRLVEEFAIESEPGHTLVTIAVSRRQPW